MPQDILQKETSVKSRNQPAFSRIHPVFWLFVIAFFVRLIVLMRFSASSNFIPDGGDMKFYSDWALQILRGQLTDGKAFYGLPGYAFLLAGIYRVAGGFDPFTVGLLQCLSESLTAVILFQIARHAFEGEPGDMRSRVIGWVAALGWVFFQPAQAFSVVLMPTTWLVLAFWGCVLWMIRTRKSCFWNPWLAMGFVLGAVAMMIATILFLVPLAIAAILLSVKRESRFTARVPAIGLAVLCLVSGVYLGAAPCWMHNYFIAHEPVMLSAHSGINFYIGNNPIANGYTKIPPGMRAGQQGMLKDSITMAEIATGHPMKRADVSKYWSAKAGDYIHNHFSDWLLLMCIKLRNFWNAYQYDDLSLVALFSQDHILLPGLRFGFVAALAIPGMIFCGFKYRRSRWVIAAILLHMAALLPVFITERYRLAAAPGLLLMMSGGLWEAWTFLIAGKWMKISAWMLIACAAAVLVSWPNSDRTLYALDYYNTGIKWLSCVNDRETGLLTNPDQPAPPLNPEEKVNLERAEKNLDIAYRYVPENPEFNFAMGNLLLTKGEKKLAERYFLLTIRLDPRHSSAFNNLGVLAMQDKNWGSAEKYLVRSLTIEPEDGKTWYLLAMVEMELGNTGHAKSAISRAMKINPGQHEFKELLQKIDGQSPANQSGRI